MEWILWAALLLAQNASFTAVSRARNSNSLWYNGIASVASNGIWIVNQFFLINKFLEVKSTGDTWAMAFVVMFYLTFTTIASVGMQKFLMLFEKKRDLR